MHVQIPEFDGVPDAVDDTECGVRVLLHHITRFHLFVRKHLFPEVVADASQGREGMG